MSPTTDDRSLSVVITDEDKRRSDIDKFNIRMTQVSAGCYSLSGWCWQR